MMTEYSGVARELIAIMQAHDEQVRDSLEAMGFDLATLEPTLSETLRGCTGEKSESCEYCKSHCFDDSPVAPYFGREVSRQGLCVGD